MTTIAEKSRSKEIIERMQSIIDGAPSVPLVQGKISVYKDELQGLLNELAIQMDTELKTYHEVNDRRGKIISEAKQAAEQIIHDAEFSASRMRVNKSATSVAPLDVSRLNQEELDSLSSANEIYAASLIYTDEMMMEVSNMITTAYSNIRSDYEIVLNALEEKINTVNSNREELMNGLREMDGSERSQQIMEIGQLLSNELYMSRMKAKTNPDQYEDGSVQLRLDLEEQEEKARVADEQAQRAARALEAMTAERDALKATVERMKNAENTKDAEKSQDETASTSQKEAPSFVVMEKDAEAEVSRNVEEEQTSPSAEAGMAQNAEEEQISPSAEAETDDEEYEVVYVSEDELEDGEEYEVEYVDDEEYEEIMSKLHSRETENKEMTADSADSVGAAADDVKADGVQTTDSTDSVGVAAEAVKADDAEDDEDMDIPLIPTFKRAQKIASIPASRLSNLRNSRNKLAPEEKKRGFIGRAVHEKEKEQLRDTVSVHSKTDEKLTADNNEEKKENSDAKEPERDEDIKVDKDGKEYVQATMQFDDDFEIMEF